MALMHPCGSLEVQQIPKSHNALINVFKFIRYVLINTGMTFTSSLRFLYIFEDLAYCGPRLINTHFKRLANESFDTQIIQVHKVPKFKSTAENIYFFLPMVV